MKHRNTSRHGIAPGRLTAHRSDTTRDRRRPAFGCPWALRCALKFIGVKEYGERSRARSARGRVPASMSWGIVRFSFSFLLFSWGIVFRRSKKKKKKRKEGRGGRRKNKEEEQGVETIKKEKEGGGEIRKRRNICSRTISLRFRNRPSSGKMIMLQRFLQKERTAIKMFLMGENNHRRHFRL